MSAPAVIVVGYTTEESTRIFIATEEASSEASIAWRIGDETGSDNISLVEADPYRIGTFTLDDLAPSSVVEYAVAVGDSPSDKAATMLSEGEYFQVRLLPSDRPLRVGLVSCNGPGAYAMEDKYVMWDTLADVSKAGEVDLILHVGDQIYADPIWDQRRADGTYVELDPDDPESVNELTQEYRELYFKSWNQPSVRSVLASTPSVMMWDDHDIADGWGSKEIDENPPRQALFDAARQAFSEFQASHAPPPLDEGNSFATAFQHQGVAVLMIDTRTNRDYFAEDGGVVVGETQWDAIDSWLEKLSEEPPRRLYLVVGVPPAHLRTAIAEKAGKALRHHILDDLRDGWSSPHNLDETRALILRLFNFMKDSPKTEVTLLSGDVHVGTVGTIQSLYPAHETGELCNPIYQVTASAIGREPPSGVERGLMAQLQGNVHMDIGHTIEGKILDCPETEDCFIGERNFAVLTLEGEPGEWSSHGNLTVTHYAEDHRPIRQRLHRMSEGTPS